MLSGKCCSLKLKRTLIGNACRRVNPVVTDHLVWGQVFLNSNHLSTLTPNHRHRHSEVASRAHLPFISVGKDLFIVSYMDTKDEPLTVSSDDMLIVEHLPTVLFCELFVG